MVCNHMLWMPVARSLYKVSWSMNMRLAAKYNQSNFHHAPDGCAGIWSTLFSNHAANGVAVLRPIRTVHEQKRVRQEEEPQR
jgi:hypothetical protein